MNISSLLRAAALGLSLGASAAHATPTPDAGPVTKAPSPFLVPQDNTTEDSCRMRVLSYFSAENIRQIDARLNGVRAWFVSGNLSAPKFGQYSAGTESGRAYLAKDPGNVIAAIEVYKSHVDVMRSEAPNAMASFDAAQGKNMEWLAAVSNRAMEGLTQQISAGCFAPSANGPA